MPPWIGRVCVLTTVIGAQFTTASGDGGAAQSKAKPHESRLNRKPEMRQAESTLLRKGLVQNCRPEPQGDAEHPRPATMECVEPNLTLHQQAVLLDAWLIRDHETIAQLCAEIGSAGGLLICHGCSEIEAVIVGLLVLDEGEAWALCGVCIRKLPLHGAVT